MALLKNNHHTGYFITFEGSEAVGKSTLIQKTADFLKDNHIDYVQTREPGGTVFAEKIRNLIFDNSYKPSAMSELLLLFAARRDHIEQVITPALADNKVVLCDRYIDSSYVYQSMMNHIPKSMIDNLVDNFIKPTIPNLCFIIDCSGENSYERIQKRGIENRNDAHSVDYFNTLRECFLERARTNKDYPYVIIQNDNINESVVKITDHLKLSL